MKFWAHFDFFYKRNINKNILFRWRRNHQTKKSIFFIFAVILLAMPYGLSSCSQEKDVNKRRIEKEKAQKKNKHASRKERTAPKPKTARN